MKNNILTLIIILIVGSNLASQGPGMPMMQMGITSPDGELTIEVTYTALANYNTLPVHLWNNQLFSIRYPDTENPDIFASVVGGSFPFIKDGIPQNGGDGFFYQKFNANVNNFELNIASGETITVATITLVSNGIDPAVTFEIVPAGNTWADANNGATFINNVYGQQFLSYSSQTADALPIKLSRFTATKGEDDKSVNLNWASTSEINASHFEVERSQDLSTWSKIGTVDAVGESTTTQEYSFLDDNLPLNTRADHKTFYYRLKMVDNDNAHDFSEVRSVRFDFDGEADFLVYPNPSLNEVYVNLSNITTKTGPATMQIINMNGQLVKKVVLNSSDDIRVDVSNLTAGVYNFVAVQGEQTYIQKIIKID